MRSNTKKTEGKSFLDFLVERPWLLLILIFLLAVAVRSVPLRFEGMFDPDSHFHARLSNEIARTHELITWDALSLQGRVYSYPPLLHVLVGLISALTGVDALIVLKFVGVIVGGLLVGSVYLLARLFSNSESIALWSALFAGLSSIAIFRTAAHTRPDGIALMLIPFLLYLWLTRRNKLAFVLSLAMVLLHPLSAVFYGVLLGVWFVLGLLRKVSFPILLPFAMAGMGLVFFAWVWSIGLPLSNYASHVSFEASELVQFSMLGFIVFFPLSWVFSLVGLWRARLPFLLGVWTLLTIFLGVFGMRLAMYFIPFLSILAGFGLVWLVQKIRSERYAVPVLLVLILFLGFATVYVAMDGIHPYVKDSEKRGIIFLQSHAQPGDAVLTAWDQGHVLAYYTGLPQVLDGYFEFAHELEERNDSAKQALASSDCTTVKNALSRFGAEYFYLAQGEVGSPSSMYGIKQLKGCPGVVLLYSSDGARVYAHEKIV